MTKILTNQSNGHQIRNVTGRSSYFRGQYMDYGKYAWNIKYHDFESGFEIESAQLWALGERVALEQSSSTKYQADYGFERISELLGRPIKSGTAGRSGGWLVIDDELTDEELDKVDDFVSQVMKALPEFLKEEREYHAEQEREAANEEQANRDKLANDPRVKQVCQLIENIAGFDATLVINGISIDLITGKPFQK